MPDPRNHWNEAELQPVYDHVNTRGAINILVDLIPTRSRCAIAARLHALRREAGVDIDGACREPHQPGAFAEAARHASAQLAEAIELEWQRLRSGPQDYPQTGEDLSGRKRA